MSAARTVAVGGASPYRIEIGHFAVQRLALQRQLA